MAFTKIVSPGIDTTGSYTVQELNTVGVATAGTVQVGAATTVHTTGIDLGSGNITSHNINSTGIITATSFVGPVTGNITGDITGDITATSGTFSGNVSIGGTLTYEDVTNIDSVGIITARAGIRVTGGSVGIGSESPREKLDIVGGRIILNQDFQVTWANGTTNKARIYGDSGDNFIVENTSSNTERLRITSDGKIGINDTNPGARLHVHAPGSDLSTIRLSGTASGQVIYDIRQGVVGVNNAGFSIRDITNSATRFAITSAGQVGIGSDNPTAKLHVDAGTTNNATVIRASNDSTSAYATNDGGLNTALSLFSDGTNAAQGVGIQFYLQKSGNTGCISEIGATRESNGNSTLVFRTRDSGTGVNERLRITSAGDMGLGTVSPRSITNFGSFAINGTSGSFTDYFLNGTRTGTTAVDSNGFASEAVGSSTPFRVITNGTEKLRIASDGTVSLGIVDTASNATLHIRSPNSTENTRLELSTYDTFNGSKPDADIVFTQQNGTEIAKIQCDVDTSAANMADLVFHTNFGGLEERLRITKTGDIKFYQSSYISGTVEKKFNYYSKAGTAGSAVIGANAEIAFVKKDSWDTTWTSYGEIVFRVNGDSRTGLDEALRIAYDGTTTVQNNLIGKKRLVVTETTAVDNFYNGQRGIGLFSRDAYSNCGTHLEVGTDADKGWANVYLNRVNWSSGDDERMINFGINNNTCGTISGTTSGTTYNTTSDIRLKTDINPISDATDKLMNMNPVTHKWKEDPDGDTVHGFIAQEMQKISPESVHGEPDGEIMMGMDYGRITPIIVAALQDAIEEINTLKQRISELGG